MSNNLKKGNWNQLVGREIRNMNVGIVGLGSIGKQIAKSKKKNIYLYVNKKIQRIVEFQSQEG